MAAQCEQRISKNGERVWVGCYRNLHNISHWHREHEIIVCLSGQGRIQIDNHQYSLRAGTCVFCCGGSVHHIEAEADCLVRVCIFDERILSDITGKYRLEVPVFQDDYGAAECLHCMEELLRQKGLFYQEECSARVALLAICIFKGERLTCCQKLPGTASQYRQLLEMIERDYDFLSFSEAAKFMNFSEPYFSRYFKQQAGLSFSRYLNIVRTERALDLIKTDESLTMSEVAKQSGFNTIRNFNRIIKEITGYAPKQLPAGYSLDIRSTCVGQEHFDPTLESTVLLPSSD